MLTPPQAHHWVLTTLHQRRLHRSRRRRLLPQHSLTNLKAMLPSGQTLAGQRRALGTTMTCLAKARQASPSPSQQAQLLRHRHPLRPHQSTDPARPSCLPHRLQRAACILRRRDCQVSISHRWYSRPSLIPTLLSYLLSPGGLGIGLVVSVCLFPLGFFLFFGHESLRFLPFIPFAMPFYVLSPSPPCTFKPSILLCSLSYLPDVLWRIRSAPPFYMHA